MKSVPMIKKTKDQFLRYKIIDKALHDKSWVKTSEIKKIIKETFIEDISERTIQKDIVAMRDDTRLGYNAPIEYDKKMKAYRYSDREYSIMKFALQDNEVSALKFYASCLSIYGAYGIFKDFSSAIQKIVDGVNLKSRFGHKVSEILIQTDTVTTISGSEHLETIIQAIDECLELQFDYQKFTDKKAKTRVVQPYLLKEYRNRWYVIGYLNGKNDVSTFGLDRMSKLEITGNTFTKQEQFDHDKYFTNSFGITRAEYPAEEVILEFDKNQAPYIKSLPIHSTQTIIKETTKYLRISIRVIPCYELYEFILSKTPDVRVISPVHVAKTIKESLTKGLKNFEVSRT